LSSVVDQSGDLVQLALDNDPGAPSTNEWLLVCSSFSFSVKNKKNYSFSSWYLSTPQCQQWARRWLRQYLHLIFTVFVITRL